MFRHSLVKGIFFITFLNVISTSLITDMCNPNCEESDNVSVCVLDKSSVCFETFPSECIMESIKCIFQKDYVVMHANYCQLNGFQCTNEPLPIVQSPPVEAAIIPYAHSESPQGSVKIILTDNNSYNNIDENRYYMVDDQVSKRD